MGNDTYLYDPPNRKGCNKKENIWQRLIRIVGIVIIIWAGIFIASILSKWLSQQ